MKSYRNTRPETAFAIAPFAPVAVVEAHSNFIRVADEFEAAIGTLADTRTAARVSIGEAHRAAAEARVSGTKPPKDGPAAVAAKYEDLIAQGQADVQVLESATDDAGNRLADAIAANRDEWLNVLEDVRGNARRKLAKALADTRQAIADLGDAEAAPAWLAGFSLQEAKSGDAFQYGGSNVTVRVPLDMPIDSFTPPGMIIDRRRSLPPCRQGRRRDRLRAAQG
jgi:hypothetical protein